MPKRLLMPISKRNSGLAPLPADGQQSITAKDGATILGQVPRADVSDQMAVFSADLEGRVTGCNPGFSEIFGYTPEQLAGQTFATLLTRNPPGKKEDRELEKAVVAYARERGHYSGLHLAQPRSGPALRIQLRVTLLRDLNPAPLGFIAFAWPVHEHSATSVGQGETPAVVEATGTISRSIEGTEFVIASPLMHKFMGLVDRVAGLAETVLVIGETGTGKEFIARTIHESSHRRGRSWVDINCAALPENLVESELFGYEKGAFSGADASKPGLFELADKGTLFLDEIGELQLHTQVKLLRVLDGQPFYRLGGHRKIKVDVRIVAATNQDLSPSNVRGAVLT